MKDFPIRLLACLAATALLFVITGCASSGAGSSPVDFGTIRTGSYIPRTSSKRQTAQNEKPKPRVAKKKPDKPPTRAHSEARAADDDYVTRGGFR